MAQGLRAERTHREIRLTRVPHRPLGEAAQEVEQYECVIPGELDAPAWGWRVRIEFTEPASADPVVSDVRHKAVFRLWKPGDRVRLRYSSGPRKVKEVLERMKVTGTDRARWPVLEVGGRILWMRGVEVEPDQAFRVQVEVIPTDSDSHQA